MVLPQPIGLDPEAPTNFRDHFVGWSEDILAKRPDLDADAVKAFGKNYVGWRFRLQHDPGKCFQLRDTVPGDAGQ